MKKLLLLMLTVLLGLGSWQASAQQIVEIGTGTSTSSNAPYNSLWFYSFVEQIYTAEEIDMTGSITSISFNNSSSGETNNITVYMKHVNRTSFSSTSDYETVTAADIVYSGSHNFSNGWSTITLDTPFDYDGASNLLIAIHENTSGYNTQYFYYTTTTNAVVSYHSDSADPNPYNLSSWNGNNYTSNNRPNIKIEILPSGNTCYTPLSPAVSNVTAYEATLSWTPRENQTNWEVYCGTGTVDLDQVSWTPVTDTSYTFTGLTPATNYTAYVRTVCGSEVSNSRQVPFTTEATCTSVPTNVTVSNIAATTVDVNWSVGENDNAWEVVVVPTNMAPETGTPEQTSSHPYTVTNLQDNTQYKVYVRTDCGGGDHSYWSNAATFTTLPLCSTPLNVTVSQITAGSALVSWQPAVYGANSYTVGYKLSSESDYTSVSVDGLQYMLSNLEPDSTYDVIIYSNCDEGTADTVFKVFNTLHCYAGGDIPVGNGTSTEYYIPVNNYYRYTYSQQIFLASEMDGPSEIHSVSFQYSHSSPSTLKNNVTIYLGHTTKSSFSNTSDYIPATDLQQVYTGNLNCQQGWNTFTFSTPFQYNGTDNLVLVLDDNSDDYDGSSYTFYVHSTGNDYRSLHYYSDSNNPDPSNPTAVSTNNNRSTSRNNVIFGGNCDDAITCIRPNVYVSGSSESSITLDWAPGLNESAWEVEYTTDTTWISAGTANTHPYVVDNLNADTRYYFRVRSNCGSDVSDWATTTARTGCGSITQLPYFNNFDEVITDNGTDFVTCWSRYTTNPSRVVRCYGSATHSGSYALDFNYSPSCTTAAVTPMIDATIPLNTVMLDFWAYSSLGQGWMEVGTMSDPNDFSTYEFYDTVRLSAASTWNNVIISFENYTGNNQYIAFLEINGTTTSYIFDDFTINTIPSCMHPTGLAVDDFTINTVTLSWTESGSATTWAVEYGPVGFTPGTGTQVTADQIPFTVDNLTPATTYDFYVYSDCGGLMSDPFGPVSATPGQYIFDTSGSDTLTTCGVMLYDNGGFSGNYTNDCDFVLVIYPENPNAKIALTGTSSTEGNNYDYLRIYDGVGTNGTELAYYNGQNQTVNVISESGPITIRFYSDGSSTYSGFAITASCATCFPPTNVTASNPTMDGATVSWSGIGDSYVLYLNGDMTTGYNANANDTTYTFTGLNPSTLYSVQIASICGGDTSMLSSVTTFVTACDAITITADNPWTEDFENYAGSGVQQFICWETPVTEVVDNGTAPFVYCNYGEAAHSGTNTAEMKGTLNLLALPEFTNNLSELRVSFWATGYSYSSTNVEVGYMTDVTDSATFVAVANAGTPGPRGGSGGGNGNYMGPFSFNGVTASGARIALRFTGPGSSSGWNVDDFVVEIAPACQSPLKTSVTASNIGGHVATITWVDNDASHTAWTVYYKKTSETDWSTEAANDTTVQLTGLDPLTAYDVYVITNCGTVETDPDATHTIHFTTTVACPVPTGLTLSNVTTDEATVTWNGTASNYNVEYGPTGFTQGTGTVDVASTESFTMTNLDPSTSYTIYVNSDCSDNNDSLSSTVSFTFNTTQIPAALPYTADFTQANEWILNNDSCTNYWTVGNVDTVPSLFITNNGTSAGYNISNGSTVSAEKLLSVGDNAMVSVSFDVKSGGETTWDYLKVFFAPAESTYPASTSSTEYSDYEYAINAVDFSNYLSLSSYTSFPYKLNLTQGNTIHVSVEMPNPNDNPTSASTAKLVFLWRNDGSQGTQPGAIISNVNVEAITCPTPSNLTASNVASSSVTLSWTPGDQETSWEVAYGPAGFDPDDNTGTVVTTSTNTYDIQNLTSATSYDFYVRAVCSATEQSAWTSPAVHATTLCSGSVAVPYTENFDTYAGSTYDDANGIAPVCWTTYSTNTTYGAPHITSSGAYHYVNSGTNSLVFTCGAAGADAYAALPEFNQPLNTLHLNFWRAMESTSSGVLTVGYVTNLGDLAGSFVEVVTIPSVSSSNGDTISVDFNAADIPAAGYICFHWNYTTSYYSCCIDDISVTLSDSTGPGPGITDPTVATNAATGMTQTAATLHATITNPDNVTITAKGFEWKATTGGTYTQIAGTGTGNTFTANLTNLTPNTNYTFKAFITFDGQTVEGSEMTFTTLPDDTPEPCNTPTGLTVSGVTDESITITWDADANVNSWNIQYSAAGGTLNSASSNTNSYTINGLTPETTYSIQVQANCGDGNLTDWTNAVTRTTTVGISSWLENSVTLFPNPAKEYVDIRTDGDLNVTLMEVYDVYGKLINTVNVIDNPTRINISSLADGMYFVRVTTDAGTVTKTFVKR